MNSRSTTPTGLRRSQRERKPNKQFRAAAGKGFYGTGSDSESNDDKNDEDHLTTEPESDNDQVDVEPRAPTRGMRGRRGRGGSKRVSTRRKRTVNDEDYVEDGAKLAKDAKLSDDNALFNLILNPTTALQDTADNLLDRLNNSPANALAELINCVLRSCGCNASVDSNQVMDTDGVVDALDEFTEGFKNETIQTYPIASKTPTFRKFRKSLAEFISRLIMTSAELGSLYASELMPIIQAWIVPLSGSQIRSFRHTATVVALNLETALCQVGAAVDKELKILSRQKEAERAKKAGRNKAREQELDAKTREVNTRRAKIKEYLKDMFNAVFVHRSRDHDAMIRADCVHELGIWFTRHPSYFLESGFLPYLGKSLSDPNAAVRLEAAKANNVLYSKKDYVVSVNHFTQTFKPRLVEMAMSDIDLPVRLSVIQVLASIEELGLLEEDERDQLCLLVFGTEPKVRKAVAVFVKQAWSEEVDQHLAGQPLSGDNIGKEQQRAGAKCLANLFIKWSKALDESRKFREVSDNGVSESEAKRISMDDELLRESAVEKANHERIGLAVEALWDDFFYIQKWNNLLNLLLMDHTSEVEPTLTGKGRKKKGIRKQDSIVEEAWRLSEQEEEVLLHVLLAALKKATEEAKSRPKGGARGEPDDDEASLDDISLTLIKALPRLFIKHQTDPSRISMVIVIPQLMNLGMYLEMRMMAAYETLWDDVSKQFMTQSSPDVIRHTVGTIKHLLGTTSLQNANQKKIADLEEELASALRDKVGGRTRPKTGGKRALETTILHGDEIAALNVLLYRVESLFNIRNLVSWAEDDDGGKEVRLLDIFTSLMERSKLGNSSEDKMIEGAIKVLCIYVLWKTKSALVDSSRSGAERHALRQALKQQRDSIMEVLTDFVVGEDSQVTESVKRVAFQNVIDTHLVYNVVDSQHSLSDLRMSLEEETQFRLAGYVQAVIEEYADQLEEERQAKETKDLSDTEMDSDDSPTKLQKRARKKRNQASQESTKSLSLSRLEKAYSFNTNLMPFIRAVRASVISFEHAAVILTHYGRFGPLYDQLSKILTELLRNHWQTGNIGIVTVIVQNSMRGAFNLYLNDQVHSEESAIALAKLFAAHFIHRGAQLAVLGRLSSSSLLDIHKDLIDYLVRKLRHADDDEASMTKITTLFRVLSHLIATGTPPEDTLKLKHHLDDALEKSGIEASGSEKQWEGLRIYERKLMNAPKEKAAGRKRGRPKKDIPSEGEDDKGVAILSTPPKRSRPMYRRQAKDHMSGSSAASSEVELEPEPSARRAKAKGRHSTVRKKVASEDEEEPEDAPVVLKGTETPPRSRNKSTPFQSATKGSSRKRRRRSEEPNGESPSVKLKPETQGMQLAAAHEISEESFGRRLKRIKR